ncbi:MAG: hypothetical protein ACFFDK_16350 [Promethearchaeota archaeon]
MYIIYNGICLVSRQYNEKYNKKDHLLSAFISAIDSFAKEFSHKELKRLVLEDDVFSFSKINDVIFVFTHDNLKKSKLESIFTQISSKFFELYNSDFKNWNSDISIFKPFEQEAEKIITSNGKSKLIEMENFLQNQKKKRLDRKKKLD